MRVTVMCDLKVSVVDIRNIDIVGFLDVVHHGQVLKVRIQVNVNLIWECHCQFCETMFGCVILG